MERINRLKEMINTQSKREARYQEMLLDTIEERRYKQQKREERQKKALG